MHDRFARQNRSGLPPEFPPGSPHPRIDHHLSGNDITGYHAFARRPKAARETHRNERLPVCLPACLPASCHTRADNVLLGPCFKTGPNHQFGRSPPGRNRRCTGSRSPLTLSAECCFNFPSRYLFAVGTQGCRLSIRKWSLPARNATDRTARASSPVRGERGRTFKQGQRYESIRWMQALTGSSPAETWLIGR